MVRKIEYENEIVQMFQGIELVNTSTNSDVTATVMFTVAEHV